jgi:putative aminopeptidase FrvX
MNAKRFSILALAVAAATVAMSFAAQAPSDWGLFRTIVMIPGISGQETKVVDWIASMLPKGVKAVRDAKNDLWFTAGEGKPHILFVAHTDELGMTVDRFTPQGTVLLRGRGGFLPQACEARPFVIHTAKGPVDGIMLPRPDYDDRGAQPFALSPYELYVGADSEAEARALGIAPGDQVIFKKKIVDLAPGVSATRAVDDRAGCAALLAAALETDWSKIKGRTVTCAWSVQEETGLYGASEIAKVLKPDYVFAIDTFVSTDSPLENKRFGYAALGQGAVLRVFDSSMLTPKPEIRKAADLAAKRKIPVQIRNSRGGNDGSVFIASGAEDIPLSWPGVHAHSFVEKIVRSDLEALTKLVKAIIEEWE